MRRLVLALALLAVGAPTAGAAPRWSPTKAYDRPAKPSCNCVTETAPRVAVNARGAAVAAWVDGTHGGTDRVRVAVAARAGRFGRAVTVAGGLRPSPAIAPDGAVTVVWSGDHDTLRFARRAAGAAKRFGAVKVLARKADGAHAAAQPDGSVVVVYEGGGRLRAVTISPRGVAGRPVALGLGGLGHDTLRVAADGTIAACCVQPANDDPNVPADTATKVAVYRHAGGWRLVSADGLGEDDAIETVFANATDVIAGVLRVHQGGDAGLLGEPGLVRATGDGPFGAPTLVPGVRPTRGLAPSATIDGSGRSVLVYQEKSRSEAFSRTAPVYASFGNVRQQLDPGSGYEPTVRPFATGALAAWQRSGNRWGIAIERAGRFRAAPMPAGRGPSTLGEDFNYNHDLATSSRYAVLAWTSADGAIRVAELRGS
jgi:hypothetical protein